MDTLFDLAVVFVGAFLAFQLNALLQHKFIKIDNKHKTIDLLFKYANEYERLYIEYWKQSGNRPEDALEIKIKQAKISDLLRFAKKEYGIKHTGQLQFMELFEFASGGEYQTTDRKPDLKKCTEISHLANKLVITLLKNKI